MASTNEAQNVAGRRTRSGRKVSEVLPISSPARATRRTQKKLAQELLNEPEPEPEAIETELLTEPDTTSALSQQSDIIKEMLAEAAQGTIIDDDGAEGDESDVIEIPDNDFSEVDDIIEEVQREDEEEDCIIYEEEELQMDDIVHCDDEEDPQQVQDVEMFTVVQDEEEHEEELEPEPELEPDQELEPVNNETPANRSTAAVDEKSSSFPFSTVVQSENSEDLQNEEVEEENNDDDVAATGGTVESSLLASLAGDNANSLPSVGGGEELDNKKDDFEDRAVEPPSNANIEKMESDDSLSEPALAEEIPDGDQADASNATIVNTEMVSEDELPMPTKPEINDAEEVSDEELPAPQRAELPPDAEVISEDELPASTAADKKSPDSSPKNSDTSSRQKRKAEVADTKTKENSGDTKTNDVTVDKKSDLNEQYNPMSPTGESNDGVTPPVEKKAKIETEDATPEPKEKKKESKEKEKEKKKLPDLDKYWRSVKEDPADFTGWTYLLQYVDNESDAEAAREAYDAFLAHYPYCYGYWRKYADYEKRKGIKANCNTVFERGLEAIPLSVDLWIHYLAHVKSSNSGDNEDFIRAQFERAINACGLEFRSDKLWDAYIKWENDNKRYQRIVEIYDRLLAIPTQGYSGHFDNTISAEELIKIRTDLRESTVRSSKSKERRAASKEKDHKESVKEKEHKESVKEKEHKEPVKEKEHKESSKEKEHKESSKEKDHKESSKEREHKESSKEKEHKESSRSSDKEKETSKSNSSDKEKQSEKEKDSKEELNEKIHTKKESKNLDHSSKDASEDEPMETDAATKEENIAQKEENITPKEEKTTIKEPNMSDLSTLTESEISSIKDKVISIRRKLHKNTVAAVTARWTYEEGIKRPYFHVKPLERCQLKNWKDYLDYEIEKGDRKRILVLFERCLIACALYDEFWLKMIRYLETLLDQPNIPELTSNVYRRACEIHHPDKPSLHLMWSAYEECQKNFDRAAEVLVKLENKCPNMLQVAYRRINVERRRGDNDKCKELYEHYISTAKNKTIAGSLAIKYARFLNKICNDIDGGLRVLRQTLEKDVGNTRVALQMIDLTLQRPKVDEDEVVLIMDKFMARENIDPEQKVLFAQRKVEFLEDFGSSAKGLQDAQRALQVALNKANEAKKKRESSPSRKSASSNKDGMSSSIAQSSAYNNGANAANANYNYNSANSAYYGQQNSGAYQQSYDGYYNQWQYGGGSSGYSGYGQWSGYGNYY